MVENYYELLELSEFASSDEIKASFRRLAKEHHPDANGGDAAASERYQKIRRAYENLIDPDLRHNYNKSFREELAKKKKQAIREQIFTIDTARKLEIILAWSTTRPSFKASFVSSCLNRMAEGGVLSQKQLDAIDNIIISFGIDIDKWQDDELRNSAIDKFLQKEENYPFSAFESEE